MVRLPNTHVAKRLGEFQLSFLAFGMTKKAPTVNTQPIRYHLTIPKNLMIRGSTVSWIIPSRTPVVSTSFLDPYTASNETHGRNGVAHISDGPRQ